MHNASRSRSRAASSPPWTGQGWVCPLLLTCTALLFTACRNTDTSSPESNSAGAYATGKYRNLFAEAGYAKNEIRSRVDAAFRQLFHGNPETEAVYFAAGTNSNGQLAQIRDIASNDVRSEGMSYGMMIAVQLDKKPEFDALWNWARTFTYHTSPTHPARGYFAWSVSTNGVPNDEMPAPDGEEYFATALYFASARWGDGKGIYNYRAEADQLLTDMRHRKVITGPTVGGTKTAGAIFDVTNKMVRFTPDVTHWNHTDPSYHLPAFYEVWARCGPPSDRAFWSDAATVSRQFFHRTTHPVTGLSPDYANFDGTPWAAPWTPDSANFQFDAWRTAMNWSMDWSWWARDAGQRELSDRLQAFFESRGMATYGNRFKLDGTQIGHDHSSGLVAMNAVAGLAATHPRSRLFIEAFWNTPVPTGHYRYYDGMLYMMALLHCSGEFRVWLPQ
ncbi:MAG TPA: glycosyl hydrolase family 8 [Verrucomicrobiota bacterium]|nr:glycosyl hydrolase family 8 [Verrucomicrobiota bacterium]